jgi:hypothetical protein
MTTKTTSDKLALVDVFHHWTPIDPKHPPPRGVKLLLIDQRLGVAVIGSYSTNTTWTHYAGLPTFKRET